MAGENEKVLTEDEGFQEAVLTDGSSQVFDSGVVGIDLLIDLVVQPGHLDFGN